MKILHLSDLHLIGDEKPSLYGIDPVLRLERAFSSMKKWHTDASFIAVSGDLCDIASPKAYLAFYNIVQKSGFKVFPVMGNHDNRELFYDFFPHLFEEGFVQYCRKFGNKTFIFLDTMVDGEAYGALCDTRKEWLRSNLELYKDDKVYLFMHHHPVQSGLYDMDNMADFKSREFFWKLLEKYNNVRHIAFGHLHRIFHGQKNGITFHATRSTTFQVAYRIDIKEELLTNEENPTYAVLNIEDNGEVSIHHHEFMNEERVYKGYC